MGGKNSRMNGNVKGLLKLNNMTFLEKIKENYEINLNFNAIEDIYKEIGPLGGIYSSLLNCKEEYLFITACDMPFITKKNIKELCDNINKDIDIAVFCDKDERLYPLCAIYSKKVIPIIEEMIKQKNYKLSYLIDKSNFVKINIEDTDIELETLSNINTPQEYDSLKNKI